MSGKRKRSSKNGELSSGDRKVKKTRSSFKIQKGLDVKYRKVSSEDILVVYDQRKEVVRALKCVGQDDPALMLDWVFENVDQMVNALNANPPSSSSMVGNQQFSYNRR